KNSYSEPYNTLFNLTKNRLDFFLATLLSLKQYPTQAQVITSRLYPSKSLNILVYPHSSFIPRFKFHESCDEIDELDLAVALQQLIEILDDAIKHTNKGIQKLIKSQLQQ